MTHAFHECRRHHMQLLEIGSYAGDSARLWHGLILDNCPQGGEIVCVDTWRPYHTKAEIMSGSVYPAMDSELRSGQVFDEFLAMVKAADSKVPIHWFKGTSHEYLLQIELDEFKPFDFIYIDGSHHYEDVKVDIEVAKALIDEDGIICGDDLERQYDESTHDTCMNNKTHDFVNSFHPGVTLAVYEAFGRLSWNDNGIWAVRRNGDKFESI